MKTIFKAIVLAASLSMVAGSTFATDLDLASLTTAATVVDADSVAVAFAALTEVALTGVEDNLAAIVQFGDSNANFAFINQTSTGINNVAVISQDSSNAANSAAIVQVGAGNRALINQH